MWLMNITLSRLAHQRDLYDENANVHATESYRGNGLAEPHNWPIRLEVTKTHLRRVHIEEVQSLNHSHGSQASLGLHDWTRRTRRRQPTSHSVHRHLVRGNQSHQTISRNFAEAAGGTLSTRFEDIVQLYRSFRTSSPKNPLTIT